MNEINPYETPLASIVSTGDSLTKPESVTAEFVFDFDHLLESLKRFRSQSRLRLVGRIFRYFLVAVLVVFAAISMLTQDYVSGIGIATAALFICFSYKLDNWNLKRSFSKSPHCNSRQTVSFDDEGYGSRSENHDATLKWSAFIRATIFDDGVLLYQGPKLINWIPDSALQEIGDAAVFRNLVRSKLPTTIAR